MAEMIKEIKTRVALRTGDYAYWTTGAGKDIELYKGEVCICTVAVADNQATTAPTVLFKVADANGKKFGDLNWVSGLAADVYAWAKKETPDWTDFPALPLEVVDEGAGKFVTDFTYVDNKLTITRAAVDWTDVQNKPTVYTEAEIKSFAADEINTLIGAADDEGGETIQKIADLVDYVEKNGAEIAQLVTDVGTANTNASNAVSTANNAATTAGNAATVAGEAKTLATEAKEAATNATTGAAASAAAAAESASTASTKAGEAAASASAASASESAARASEVKAGEYETSAHEWANAAESAREAAATSAA